MASERKLMHRNRALPVNFALKCLEIQLNINSNGKNAQDLVRKKGMLLKIMRKFRICQERRQTYFAVSPVLLNVFVACAGFPVNEENQAKLRSIIPQLITVLAFMSNKRKMRKHIYRHWLLMEALLDGNRRNVKMFIKNGGKHVMNKYQGQKEVQMSISVIQKCLDQFRKTGKDSSTENSDVGGTETNVVDELEPVEEVINEDVENENETDKASGEVETEQIPMEEVATDGPSESDADLEKRRAAREELERVIALTNLRKEERRLRKSLEAKQPPKDEQVPKLTPVKTFVNILRRLSWGKE